MTLADKIVALQSIGTVLNGTGPEQVYGLLNQSVEMVSLGVSIYQGPVDMPSGFVTNSPAGIAAKEKIAAADAGEPEREGDLILPDIKAALLALSTKAAELAAMVDPIAAPPV